MATDAQTPAPQPTAAQPKLPFPLHEAERVLLICRRHWIYLWPRILLMLALALIPPAVVAFIMSKADAFDGTAAKVFWIVAALYVLFWVVRMLFAWYGYHNDIWVVTNQRLIDSRRTNPFSLELSTADLVNVQDMTVERRGIFQTMLDFGDVVCQTAADVQEFRISGVPHPREVQAMVDRERDRERLRYRNV